MMDTAARVIAGATYVQAALSTNREQVHQFRISAAKNRGEQMEYLIVIGVIAMMALYAVIIAGCLKQPEW